MIGRLRELADRPIADAERRRLFALAVALLALAAGALLAIGPAPERRPVPSAPPEPPLTSPPAPAPRAPAEGPEASLAPATRAARRFLASYLRLLYGHAGARELERATPQLRRRLSTSRLRVPPAAHRRHPHIVGLEARRTAGDEITVSAEVEDGGVARYPVSVTMRRTGPGWRAVAVGAD